MKLAVTGTPLRKRPATGCVVSPHQTEILKVVKRHPGLNVYSLQDLLVYTTLCSLERALQGLIKRGLLRWESNSITRNMRYYITPKGIKIITEDQK